MYNICNSSVQLRLARLLTATSPSQSQSTLIITLSISGLFKKVSGLTTVHEVDKTYGGLTLIVFNIVPFRSYTLRPTFLPLLETFCEIIFRDV